MFKNFQSDSPKITMLCFCKDNTCDQTSAYIRSPRENIYNMFLLELIVLVKTICPTASKLSIWSFLLEIVESLHFFCSKRPGARCSSGPVQQKSCHFHAALVCLFFNFSCEVILSCQCLILFFPLHRLSWTTVWLSYLSNFVSPLPVSSPGPAF